MRVKPYVLVFKSNLSKEMSYRFNFLFSFFLHITRLLICLAVWSVIFSNHEMIKNYTWNEMASYYGISMIVVIIYYPGHMFDLQPLIRKGTLSALLIKPINMEANIFAKFCASKLPTLIVFSGITFLTLYLIGISLTLSVTPITIAFCCLSFFLSFYFGLCVSVLAFWLVEMWPLRRVFQGCMALFGGVIAPLDLLPNYISTSAFYSPFPYLGYFNVKAIQGKLTEFELLFYCAITCIWILVFVLGFRLLWNLGLKRYEAVNL